MAVVVVVVEMGVVGVEGAGDGAPWVEGASEGC